MTRIRQRQAAATATARLPTGRLSLFVERADWRLDELCGFASRRNRKRGFLFVSRVLGKHVPVRPSVMNRSHRELAGRLAGLALPAVVVALAETATALGQGVFEHLCRQAGGDGLLFLHTTRYRLARPVALRCDEAHSHAPDHLLYEPADADDARLFCGARSLVLVDDEVSTGRTLAGLAREYRRLNPGLEALHVVSLTDWLPPRRRDEIAAEVGVSTRFHQLLRGRFTFTPDAAFDPGAAPDVIGRGDLKDRYLVAEGGRLGVRTPLALEADRLLGDDPPRPGERVLVLGTGEFAYPPYRLALELERRGLEVRFQSTTRSPILLGGAINSSREFVDNYHDDIPNYLYNTAGQEYDRVLIGYETRPLPERHHLAELLGGKAIFFQSRDREGAGRAAR